MNPGRVFVSVVNTRSFGRFWPVSWTITHCFGSRRDFHDRRTPRCVYVSVINTRSFWPNLTRFMDYYSLFWGPGVISMIDEPRGAFTCRSSTLAVLADSGPFHGQLLTVLGSWTYFHD